MLSQPANFHEYLAHHDLTNDVYKAMENPDLAYPVMTVLDILKKIKHLPDLTKEQKTEAKSTAYRNEGNVAYGCSKYQVALICYNQALLTAPHNSRAMKLAYSNRSALLHKMKSFGACIADIDTCFSLGCPDDIQEKLMKRKKDALENMWMEKIEESEKRTYFSDEFFEMNVTRNPMIPCATTDIGVIMESELPKVVATRDIKVGSVVAVETAFVSFTDQKNAKFSCHHCHKMNLNLVPCETCAFALFCDDTCRRNALNEYHSIECQIMEVLEASALMPNTRLAVRAALKIKLLCKSWKPFIAASYETGTSRMKNSSINQIYDFNYKFSLLNSNCDKHFFNGPLYNACFTCATIMNYLETVSCFFPQACDERKIAMQALARMLVHLFLFSTNTIIISSVSVSKAGRTEFHKTSNCGKYSFIGKLRHECNANLLTVGLNKKLALIALQPIKQGTELTVSYVGHWLDNEMDKNKRNVRLSALYGLVCDCPICCGDYKHNDYKLTEIQEKSFRRLNFAELNKNFVPRSIPDIYAKMCKNLAFLSDIPYSNEYYMVYRFFRRCTLYLQDIITNNEMLDHISLN